MLAFPDMSNSNSSNKLQGSQAHDPAWQRWSSSHRAIFFPFVYAPDLIKAAHPFGIYAPGTMPELDPAPTHSRHVTYQDVTALPPMKRSWGSLTKLFL
jgi:hypothetical protein